MNSILLVLIDLDSDSFFDNNNLMDYIDKYRESHECDITLLSMYSIKNEYYSRGKIKQVQYNREQYPQLVFSRIFTKDKNNLLLDFNKKGDRYKDSIYSYMVKYLTNFIDIKDVLILDESLLLSDDYLSKTFGDIGFKVISKQEELNDNRILKKTIN